jgi:hypothetical protein
MMNDKRTLDLMQLLEAVERGDISLETCLQQNPMYRVDLIELFALTGKLESIALPEPNPRFRSSARNRILTAMQAQEPVTFSTWFRHIWQSAQQFSQRSPSMTIALIVALILSMVGGSSVYASQQAIPGDLLYPLKMQIEDLQLAAAPDQVDENLYFQFAEERVEEVLALIEQGRYQDIPAAMSRLQNGLNNVSDVIEKTPEKGRSETAAGLTTSLTVLSERLGQVPEAAMPGMQKASESILRAQERFNQMQEPAGKGKPDEVPGGKPDGIPAVLPTQAQDRKPGNVPGGRPSTSPVLPTPAKPDTLPTVVPTIVLPVQPTANPVNPPVPSTIPPTEIPVNPVVPPIDPPVEPPAQPTVPVTRPGGRP